MDSYIVWIQAHWIEITAAVVCVEKLINIIVGWTSSKEDDKAWAKVLNTVQWFLNVRSLSQNKGV